jgi:hypothetical protein
MLTLPEAEPEFPFAGAVGSLTGIPVIKQADFEPGVWELFEDGEVKACGRIRVPPWVTEPIKLDVEFSPAADRLWRHSLFPITSPVPMAGLSSIC